MHSIIQMIAFDESTHQYSIDGDTSYVSVTTKLSSWFKKFDPKKVLRGMRASPSWINSQYVNMTDDEIMAKWNADGKVASDLGTEMHAHIELFLQDKPVVNDTIEFSYFKQFAQDASLIVHALEWRVFDRKTKIVGTIDCASVNEDGTLDLYDWKRCGDMTRANGYCIHPPLVHIPDSKYWKYSLQLNMYKYVVEASTTYKIRNMYIVCFHPSNLGYQKFRVAEINLENVLNI